MSPRSLQGQCGMLSLVRAGVFGWARPLPVPPRGQDSGEVVRPSSVMRLRQEEGVVADPGFSDWPDPLSLVGPRSFGLKLGFSIVGHPACPLFDALRHPRIITPTTAFIRKISHVTTPFKLGPLKIMNKHIVNFSRTDKTIS